MPEQVLLAQEVDGIDTHPLEEHVYEPVAGIEKHIEQSDKHDYGNEVRCVGHCLGDFLEGAVPQLVEHEREQDGQGKSRDQLVQTYADGVLHQIPELVGLDEAHEVSQSHPRASEHAL